MPQPELIIFHWPCDRQADCRLAHTKRKKQARQRAVIEPLESRERADPEPPESTHTRRGEETDAGTAGAHWCMRRMCTESSRKPLQSGCAAGGFKEAGSNAQWACRQ